MIGVAARCATHQSGSTFLAAGAPVGTLSRQPSTSPPLTSEVFPYEFYKIVPDGVTLVITTLAIVERSRSEVEQSYKLSMKAARAMAAAGVDSERNCGGAVPCPVKSKPRLPSWMPKL